MSIRAYSFVLKLPIRPAAKKSVMLVLADYASDMGKSYPQTITFTRDSGLSRDAVETHLATLCADGLITDTGIKTGPAKDIRVFQLNPVKELKLMPDQPKPRKPLKCEASEEAMQVWEIYPPERRVAKPKTLALIARAIKIYGFEIVRNGTQSFADAWKGRTDLNFCLISTSFFNQERFADDPTTWTLVGKTIVKPGALKFRPLPPLKGEPTPPEALQRMSNQLAEMKKNLQ